MIAHVGEIMVAVQKKVLPFAVVMMAARYGSRAGDANMPPTMAGVRETMVEFVAGGMSLGIMCGQVAVWRKAVWMSKVWASGRRRMRMNRRGIFACCGTHGRRGIWGGGGFYGGVDLGWDEVGIEPLPVCDSSARFW